MKLIRLISFIINPQRSVKQPFKEFLFLQQYLIRLLILRSIHQCLEPSICSSGPLFIKWKDTLSCDLANSRWFSRLLHRHSLVAVGLSVGCGTWPPIGCVAAVCIIDYEHSYLEIWRMTFMSNGCNRFNEKTLMLLLRLVHTVLRTRHDDVTIA